MSCNQHKKRAVNSKAIPLYKRLTQEEVDKYVERECFILCFGYYDEVKAESDDITEDETKFFVAMDTVLRRLGYSRSQRRKIHTDVQVDDISLSIFKAIEKM